MYAWIDSEKWAANGQPGLTERHGVLVDVDWPDQTYGKIFGPEDQDVIVDALIARRLAGIQDPLPLT